MTPETSRRGPAIFIALVVGVLAAICVYAVRQVDADLYGYLAYGRYFLQRGLPDGADPFSYTSDGTPWVAFEYLAQIVLWMAYHQAGPVGLIALKCALGGAAVALLWMATHTAEDAPLVWVPVFLLSTSTLSRYFLFRPQLFTFVFFALFVTVLMRVLLRRPAPLWPLPVAMALWVNVHGGFLAGLGAVGLAIALRFAQVLREPGRSSADAARATRALCGTFALCVAATFVNPWGARLWQDVLTELTHETNRRHIAEWRPAFSGVDPWSAAALTFIVCLLFLLGVLATRRRLDVAGLAPWQWVASAAPLIVMSYGSVRHVPLAAIWAAPVIALLAGELRRKAAASFAPIWMAVACFVTVPVLLTTQYVVQHPRPVIAAGGQLLGRMSPCRAANLIAESGIEGNVYAPLWWGGYLTWRTYPAMRVAMDGRNISAFPRETVEDNLRFYSTTATPADLDVPLRHATDVLLVPADSTVMVGVRNDLRWTRVYVDSDAELFVRNDAPHAPLIASLVSRASVARQTCAPTLE